MFNWRRILNTALTATIASSTLMGMAGAAYAETTAKDFKFPIVLCRFKQAVLRDSGGLLKVVTERDWGPEYAFPVGNVRAGQSAQTMEGDFAGTYEIPNSSYRLRLEGGIEQGLDAAGANKLSVRTVLEKKLDKPDASGNLWQEVGHSRKEVVAKAQSDGTVWENVYPYTFNSVEMKSYVASGKLRHDQMIAGIRDGLLDKGAVFKVGPACGFLDARTAKSVASVEDRQKYSAIFDRIADAPQAVVVAPRTEAPKTIQFKLPEPSSQEVAKTEDNSAGQNAAQNVQDERDRQDQQNLAQEAGAQSGAQQEMAAELQAQLAQQGQLADQAAAAYNFQAHQVQNGMGMPDGRDPASAQALALQMPQANSVGQLAQNLQAIQSPDQVQQHLNMLEERRQALLQQQTMLDQQQQFLMQKQQDLAEAPKSDEAQPIQTSQAAPMGHQF